MEPPIDVAKLSAPDLASLETLRLGLTRQEVLKTFRAAGAFRIRSDYSLPQATVPPEAWVTIDITFETAPTP